VSRVKHRCRITSLEVWCISGKTALLASGFGDGTAALNGRVVETASLHFSGAMAEVALAGFHKGGTLFYFMASIVAGVGHNASCQDGSDGERGEELHFEASN
jgi:hypothetical protein